MQDGSKEMLCGGVSLIANRVQTRRVFILNRVRFSLLERPFFLCLTTIHTDTQTLPKGITPFKKHFSLLSFFHPLLALPTIPSTF